jgi:hypothetical protein
VEETRVSNWGGGERERERERPEWDYDHDQQERANLVWGDLVKILVTSTQIPWIDR